MANYEPSKEESVLHARFVLDGSVHEWTQVEKGKYLIYLNNRAGLPFGTIGLLRTEHKKKSGEVVTKEIPYASRQTTVELGRLHKISVQQMKEVINAENAIYTYRAIDGADGRFVDAVGACALIGNSYALSPEARANKIMHAETKAKRRATLEVCGLAFLDDSEVDDIEGAKRLDVAHPTGEVVAKNATRGNGTPPKPAATTPPAAPIAVEPPAPVLTGEPVPERYAGNPLFDGDDAALCGDKAHVGFIVSEATKTAGWTGADLTKWLFEAFAITNQNAATTLTLGMFRKIMAGIATSIESQKAGA